MLSGAALLSLPFNSVVLFPALAQLELHDTSFPAGDRPWLASELRQGWRTKGFSDRLRIRPRRCVNLLYHRTIALYCYSYWKEHRRNSTTSVYQFVKSPLNHSTNTQDGMFKFLFRSFWCKSCELAKANWSVGHKKIFAFGRRFQITEICPHKTDMKYQKLFR